METESYGSNEIVDSVNVSKENICGTVNHSGDGHMVNGISNGLGEKIQKSEHREKSKDKHRDHKDKSRDKDKYKDKDRDHKHSSSSEHRSKDKHSSSGSSSRDKERDKQKEKDRGDGHREKDKHREKSESSKHRDEKRDKDHKSSSGSSSHKDKDREHKEKRDGERKESSSGSSKHNSSSSKSHSSSSSKDKDKHSSSSSSKDKERSDKDKHRSDKEKSKHSSDKKDKHSSSSSRDKEKRDKDKEKEKEKERSKEDKLKHEKEKAKRRVLDDDDDIDGDFTSSVPRLEIKQEPESQPVAPTSPLEDRSMGGGDVTVKSELQDEDDYSSSRANESSLFTSRVDDTFDDEESELKIDEGSAAEEDDEEDIPLAERSTIKREASDDEDDTPLIARKKVKKEKQKHKKRKMESEDEEEDFKPVKKKQPKKPKVKQEEAPQQVESPKKKKKEDEQEVWKWWEEEKKPDGVKWTFLEHKGPVFAADYEPLPPNVKFFYDGKEMRLSQDAEEVATFYARMLEHDYTTKEAFNTNFFKDWRKTMTPKEKETITDLKKCNFRQMHAYFQQKSEERKAMTKEEKKVLKDKNEELIEEYGFCVIDGHKEKIGNFKIEPPGLFRGRGEHPKMGMLKKRVMPEDVLINCSKDSKIPEPPPGHKWKEVRHDNTVTWLASWTENVQGQVKYVMLNPSSKLKGEKDMQKYETARKLAKSIDKIRREYREDWKSKEMRIRQRAVALYFIDILALRAGNEKDEDQADTVGCCSLRVEHISLHPEKDGKEYVVVFDFLGKDSIRYYNEVPVEKRVFKNLQLFMEGKKGSDDLFDRLNTTILNKHLNELMEGLTAKVFRTYNASWTLQQQLEKLTDPNYTVPEMILAYNRANRAVAILCNHQRSIPKSHQKSMDNLKEKIQAKKDLVEEAEKQYKVAKREAKNGSAKERINADKAKKKLERLREQLQKLEVQETDREENKTIALGTSKLNYLDPRISVAWCKKYNIPIEKVYNKTQRQKFRWAIDMAGPDYVF